MTKEEAIKRIREWNLDTDDMEVLSAAIPELTAETDDEGIRKSLLAYIKGESKKLDTKRWISYLEKQKNLISYYEEKLDRCACENLDKGIKEVLNHPEEYGLEKQKEQKEIPLMNGDADLYFDNWIQHNDTTKRGCFEEGIRYAQRLQKEQTLTEKEITLTDFEKVLNTFLFDFANSTIEDCEPKDYIKKHSAEILKAAYKELNTQLQQDLFEAKQEGRREGYEVAKEELKPAEWSGEDEDMLRDISSDLLAGSAFNIEFQTIAKKKINWLKTHLKSCRPSLSSEWSKEDEKILNELLDYCNTANATWYNWLKSLRPQSKQEWSDEDSDNLERVDNYLWMLDDYVGDDCAMPQGKTDNIRGNIQGILSPWLKSLPERFNLQPKQEWSEEDKKVYTFIYNFFENSWWDVTWDISREQVLKMLKSLRPQIIDSTPLYAIEQVDEKIQEAQEQSEEEKKIIGNIRHLIFEHAFENGGVDVNGDYCKDVYQEADDFLKSLRPKQKQGWRRYIWAVNLCFDYDGLVRYEDNGSYEIVTAGNKPKRQVNGEYILLKDIQSIDWKPSEEQMKQLKIAADLWEFGPMVTTRKEFPDLESLYEQLKKMI